MKIILNIGKFEFFQVQWPPDFLYLHEKVKKQRSINHSRFYIFNFNNEFSLQNFQLNKYKTSSFQTNITLESHSPILIQYCPAKKSSNYCCAKKNTSNLNNNLVRTVKNGRIQYVSTVPLNAGARRVVKMLGNFYYFILLI